MNDVLFAYITTANLREARALGHQLVEKRLAACVNFWEGMESLYWWEGKIETGRECVLVAKTTRAAQGEFLKCVRETHSYEVPCVVFLPVQGGNPDYLRWVDANVVS